MTLERVKNPDKVEVIKVDWKRLPRREYKEAGYEKRQEGCLILRFQGW
jgi:hypothetical protein